MPVDDLEKRLKELPRKKAYVAYCRGPYCIYADRAVEILKANGRHAKRLREGFPDWRRPVCPWRVRRRRPFERRRPMIFRPYHYFDTGCAAYLFGCGTLGKCAVVDAQERDVEEYAAFAASKAMRITHVIDTHVHADHRSGGPALADRAGAAYCLYASAPTRRAFQPLEDGEEIDLGNTKVRVLHTPVIRPRACLSWCRIFAAAPSPGSS
jgi:hypothetical protein